MLQNIKIQNFRCFKTFYAEGFERVNLIGGKNNSGKTCLLEGIQCINIKLDSIAQQRNQVIPLLSIPNFDLGGGKGIKICFTDNKKKYENTIFLTDTMTEANRIGEVLNTPIQYIKGELKNPEFEVGEIVQKFQNSSFHNPSIGSLVEILQIIEPKVKGLLYMGSSKHSLGISVSNQLISLSDFGDGFKYLLNYFIKFIDKKNSGDTTESILLIDEIENGIHHTAHKDFWKTIFKLSKELKVQVFATTHSLEMIKAFNEVAKSEGGGAYFEMAREYETGQIFAQKHDADLLEYELEKTTATFRGE
jgi:AAA15 family ATPase/GTPase